MLTFQPLRLEDAPIVRPYFEGFRSGLCDYSIGGTVMWRDYYGTCFAIENDILYFRIDDGDRGRFYSYPVADSEEKCLAGIDRLAEQTARAGVPLIISNISAERLPAVLRRFPNAEVASNPDWFDYLYDLEEFVSLRGKKYSGQRNHLNHFRRNHPDWRVEKLGKDNMEAVSEFLERYIVSRDKIYDSFYFEEKAVREVLKNYELYGFFGTVLWAEGRVVAFSMGEVLGDTLFSHVEKADRNCVGAYQMISHCFTEMWGEGVHYLNREEDMGDEGLRTSKQSYHPVKMLEKFIVSVPK